eukprot:TRINITY_DN4946_c1_g1_i1.p1 TRINITY_DN4946_c1_g1~~TRINITY_DN4946_c1_g1_i1.p1  ORF type:complete len:333 (+),score=104.53 TRINITY_DN4946_c1_g1_i1:71-1000(+)
MAAAPGAGLGADAAVAALGEWISSRGGDVGGVLPCSGPHGRGLAAARALRPGDTAAAVPLSCLLTAPDGEAHPAGAALAAELRQRVDPDLGAAIPFTMAAEAGAAESTLLALALAAAESGRSGGWDVYVRTLPSAAAAAEALPVCWDERRRARAESLAGLSPRRRAAALAAIAEARAEVDSHWYKISDHPAAPDLGNFRRSAALVRSRAIALPAAAGCPAGEQPPPHAPRRGCLAPLIDLVNHSPQPNAALRWRGGALLLAALVSVPAGAELRIDYAPEQSGRPGAEQQPPYYLLCNYGIPDPAPRGKL